MSADRPMSETAETRRVVPAQDGDGIRADIANTRAELGNTLDVLVARLDVKQRAKRRLAENRASMRARVQRVRQAAPGYAQQALDRARPYRVQIAALGGGATVVAAYLLGRRRGRRCLQQ